MAPRTGIKRAAKDTKAAPVQKKPRVDPMLEGIIDAIDLAADMQESCKQMLKDMVPGSFGVAGDMRHAHQITVVQTIGEVIEGIKARMQTEIDDEANNVAGAEAVKSGLEDKVVKATSRLSEIVEDVKAKKASLADLTKEFKEKQAKLTAVQEVHQNGDASIAATKIQNDDFKAAAKNELEPLLNADLDGAQVSAHYKALLPFIAKLALVESLTTPLPGLCEKKSSARGPFDTMVLQQLEKSFAEHLVQLEKAIEDEIPASAERASAVSAAQKEHDAGKLDKEQAASDLGAAQEFQREAEGDVKSAKATSAENEVAYSKITEVRDKTIETLKSFETWNYECFKVCRDRVSNKPDVVEAKTVEHVEEGTAQVAEAGA